jgi:parallel beta-helix repeat protein
MKLLVPAINPRLASLLLVVVAVVSVIRAQAATYYVATNGNDSNPGTITQPFATFNQAIYAVGNTAGSIIYGRQGTYYQGTVPIYFSNVGTSAHHIIIEPYDNETVIIDGSRLGSSNATVQLSGKYIEFNNMHVANSAFVGILCYQSSHVWVQGNTVYNSQDGAIAVGDYATLTATNYAVISNNEAYNNDLVNQPRTATGWPATVRTQGASNVTFTNNRIHDNYGEGLDLLQSNNCSASNNIIWDNYSVEVYLDNTTNAMVNANLIYNTGNTAYWSLNASGNCSTATMCPSTSIQIANEEYPGFQNIGHNRTITNNIAIGGNQNLYYGDYGVGGGLVNDLIANNTFYAPFTGAGGASLYLDASSEYKNTLIANNIFDSDGSADVEIYATHGQLAGKVTFKTNLWYGGTNAPGLAAGTGDVLSDPKFVNVTNHPLGFELQNGSPAIDAGTTLSAVPRDYRGVARPQGSAYDIGAFQQAP